MSGNEEKYYNRLDLRDDEYQHLRDVAAGDDWAGRILDKAKRIRYSPKRANAAVDVATAARTAKAKKKIENAVNLLRMEGKAITPYSVAKKAGVSYNTARKYLPDHIG